MAGENNDLVDGLGAGTQQLVRNVTITSTTKSFVMTSLTTTERDAISSPPDGMVIYNETTDKLNVRAGGAWEAVTSA